MNHKRKLLGVLFVFCVNLISVSTITTIIPSPVPTTLELETTPSSPSTPRTPSTSRALDTTETSSIASNANSTIQTIPSNSPQLSTLSSVPVINELKELKELNETASSSAAPELLEDTSAETISFGIRSFTVEVTATAKPIKTGKDIKPLQPTKKATQAKKAPKFYKLANKTTPANGSDESTDAKAETITVESLPSKLTSLQQDVSATVGSTTAELCNKYLYVFFLS